MSACVLVCVRGFSYWRNGLAMIMLTIIIIIHKFTASAASRGRGVAGGGGVLGLTDLVSKTSHVAHDVNKCDVGACYTSLGFGAMLINDQKLH